MTHTDRNIGKTGTSVRAIGLGGMPLSIADRPSEENALEVIEASLSSGTNFIDTANVYCLDDADIGHNEKLIAKALKKSSHKAHVATKGGLIRPEGRWEINARPDFLRTSCEQSLKALETDSIFLYQLHAPDPSVPFEESVGELARLKEEGKVQHVGLSNVNITQLKTAQSIVRIESVQNRCHPFHCPDLVNGMLKECESQEVTYLAYSPVAGGRGHLELREIPELKELAEQTSTNPYRVVLSWLLSKSERMLPIPGASKINSATDSPKAIQLELPTEAIQTMDRLAQLPLA